MKDFLEEYKMIGLIVRGILLLLFSIILLSCHSIGGYPPVKFPISGKKLPVHTGLIKHNDLYNYYNYYYLGEEYRDECRQYYIRNKPQVHPDVKNAVISGTIFLGMAKDAVIASIGRPKRIKKYHRDSNVGQQWVYNELYLYLEKDRLIFWKERKASSF